MFVDRDQQANGTDEHVDVDHKQQSPSATRRKYITRQIIAITVHVLSIISLVKMSRTFNFSSQFYGCADKKSRSHDLHYNYTI
jgi:hypothetical protein